MNSPMKIEPSADQRTAAKELRGMFLALLAEEFTEPQAIAIIGHVLLAGATGNRP